MVRILNKKIIFPLLIVIILSGNYCANIVPPAGGPKDTIPPKVTKSYPENYSIRFKGQKIEISFDEFIQLKDVNNKLLVSPPFINNPEIKLKGKSLIIDLKNELHKNTTYTLNFGNAIVDNNESNVLDNFEFVFSTGDEIDSLSISGKVFNAFDLKPEEGVLVMLYENLNDSAPYLEFPNFVGKTNKNGQFLTNNIRNDTFRIFVLKDENRNYIYDLTNEAIAFSDSFVFFEAKKSVTADTISLDSIVKQKDGNFIRKDIELFLFKEDDKKQYLANYERDKRKLTFIFNIPLIDSLFILPLNFTPSDSWYIIENYLFNDTISYWITDSLISNQETLSLELNFYTTDSLDNKKLISDTINLRYIFEQPSEKKRTQVEETEKLNIKSNIKKGSIFDLGKNISIECSHPISSYDISKIKLFQIQDSLEIAREFSFYKDSFQLRKFHFYNPWDENTSYKLFIEPNAFRDIFDLTNDTLIVYFKTQKSGHYGSIILTLSNIDSNVIVQLLDEEEKVLKEKAANNEQAINFSYLKPRKYKLKLVFDSNSNSKWDNGNYLLKIQPEKVIYYGKEINVRSNWDSEVNWDIEE